MKNPVLENLRSLNIYLFAWTLVTGVHISIISLYYQIGITAALADGIIFNFLFACMAISFWYFVRYMGIDKIKPVTLFLNHITGVTIFLLLWLASGFYILYMISEGNSVYRNFLHNSIPWRLVSGFLYYCVIILIYYLHIYYSSFKEKLLKESNLRALVKETELSLLKSQLNPHFIFNSLNSISALTISHPQKAQDMIIKLSTFLRYALEHNRNQLVSFHEELENSMLYLDIEKIRFGNRLIFEKEIQHDCQSALLPNMLLQPLLENTIKHGVQGSTEMINIKMTCALEDNFLHIVISNNFDPEGTLNKGKGIGTGNVQERLYLVYGKRDLVKFSAEENIFKAELFIPQQNIQQ